MLRLGPTMISCPSCAGVVRTDVEREGHLAFICSVGYVFALEELYRAKEESVGRHCSKLKGRTGVSQETNRYATRAMLYGASKLNESAPET